MMENLTQFGFNQKKRKREKDNFFGFPNQKV